MRVYRSQCYAHSLQPHSTGFSTSCVNDVPSSHSNVSRRRRSLRGAQQGAAADTPGPASAWQPPRHSTQEKVLEVWHWAVPRCTRWKSLIGSPRQGDAEGQDRRRDGLRRTSVYAVPLLARGRDFWYHFLNVFFCLFVTESRIFSKVLHVYYIFFREILDIFLDIKSQRKEESLRFFKGRGVTNMCPRLTCV